MAGRVIHKNPEKGTLVESLVNLKDPICCVANLCIHLRSAEERSKISPNSEEHLRPIFSSEIYNKLTGNTESEEKSDSKHYSKLIDLIAKNLNIKGDNIIDLELCFADC